MLNYINIHLAASNDILYKKHKVYEWQIKITIVKCEVLKKR